MIETDNTALCDCLAADRPFSMCLDMNSLLYKDNLPKWCDAVEFKTKLLSEQFIR